MILRGNCVDCGSSALHAHSRCTPCYWKAHRAAGKRTCPACGQPGLLRADGGRCGMCTRRARPRKKPTPRVCAGCGRLRRHCGLGLCPACYQRDPARLVTWTIGARQRLGSAEPRWFAALAEDLGIRCAPAVAREHLRKVERLALTGISEPADLVGALRVPGRSAGATARLVDEFFAHRGAGSHLDEAVRRAAGRRERRLARVPEPLRPAVAAFAEHLLRSRHRAVLVGGTGLADSTIETRIADLAVLAHQLLGRGITDWAVVAVSDIEAFIITNVGSRLASCRAFFAFARRRRLILVDPTRSIDRRRPRGFAGHVLDRDAQRRLFRRWARSDVDPRERVVGLLSFIHGASCAELRHLRVDDVDLTAVTLRLGRRPHPVPLDPISATAVHAALAARAAARTRNPHLIITKDSRSHQTPASPYFMTHVLDPADVRPAVLRQTRLADLAHRIDPRLVAAAFGMTQGGALHYVTGAVDGEATAFSPHL